MAVTWQKGGREHESEDIRHYVIAREHWSYSAGKKDNACREECSMCLEVSKGVYFFFIILYVVWFTLRPIFGTCMTL